MGWGRGSELMSELIEAAKLAIPNDGARCNFYQDVIVAFEEYDCDTLDECTGEDEAFKKAMHVIHPKWEED